MKNVILVDDRNYPEDHTVFTVIGGRLKSVETMNLKEYEAHTNIYWYVKSFYMNDNRLIGNASCG